MYITPARIDVPSPLEVARSRIRSAVVGNEIVLDLSGLGLSDLPEEVQNIRTLQVLKINQNRLSSFPNGFERLRNLRALYLNNNQVAKLPNIVWEFPELRQLDLSNNRLGAISDQLGNLTKLTHLSLINTDLTTLPPTLGKLKNLRVLAISHNRMTRLPNAVFQLDKLTDLNLQNNELKELSEELSQLKALERLWINNNRLTELPKSIGNLNSLIQLAAWNNRLESLPESIGRLSSLEFLDLFDNVISELPDSMGLLAKLAVLTLNRNQLSSLPSSLKNILSLKEIYLHENFRLGLPDVVLGAVHSDVLAKKLPPNPAHEILDYYYDIKGIAGRALRETKLIFVGRGEVGKTSMVEALQGKRFVKNRHRTDGIAISRWSIHLKDGDATVLMWDFGGQEIMHGTHQFFLTRRSLYVVMVDGRHDRGKQDAEYWLKLVRAFGGNSQVLVVLNRQKEHPFNIDSQHISEKYGVEPQNFFQTDCGQASSITPLRKAILSETERILGDEERFPSKCWDVKTRLDGMKGRNEDYLSDQDYGRICEQHGVTDPTEQRKLLERLADLGTVVSFPEDGKLADFTVLNPEWVTDGIYRVVTNEELREQRHGQLKLTTLRSILPRERWPKPRHLQYLVDLMQKFDLCFVVEGMSETFLVPELLPDETPRLCDWDLDRCVVFVYQYTVLPHGVLPRFITRTSSLSQERPRWRSGVIVADDGAEALIRADYDANTISIWIRGTHTDARRSLLKVTRHHFNRIHAWFKDLSPEELVAVPGATDVKVSYNALVLDERDGLVNYRATINGKRVDIPISHILDGVESKTERKKANLSQMDPHVNRRIDRVEFNFAEGSAAFIQAPMNTTNKQVIRDSTINAPVAVNQTFNNCFNAIKEIENDDSRQVLERLVKAVEVIHPHLDEASARPKAERQIRLLTDEAAQSSPDKDQLRLSGKGLIEAAKTCAGMAGPVVEATKAVLDFFGVPLT